MNKKQTVWITGASSGIGYAFAKYYATHGFNIIITARRTERLNELKNELIKNNGVSENCIFILPGDLSQIEQLKKLSSDALAAFSGIDILINNAGVSQRGYAYDTDFEVERRILDLDLISPIALTKCLLPHFLTKKAGRIIITSSLMGELELPASTSYACAKHGLNGYFGSLSYELKPYGITVQILQPGFVKTEVSINALNAQGSKHNKMDSDHSKAMQPDVFVTKAIKEINKNRLYITIAGKEGLAIYLKRWLPSLYQSVVERSAKKLFKDRLERHV